jgi:hypothetical protein
MILSKLFSLFNPLLAITIVGVFIFYGLFGIPLFNGFIEFIKTGDIESFLTVIMSPSWWGGLAGFGIGLINAVYICGFIATILVIRKKIGNTDKKLQSLYLIEKNNKKELAELNDILRSIDQKIGKQISTSSKIEEIVER